jgi:integrase/recombinase XerD
MQLHRQTRWDAALAAYLAEVAQRTGSSRTPAEYGRLLVRFLGLLEDPGQASPALVHAFAYGPGPSGREPSPSTVAVRLAAVGGFYDFCRRMELVAANPAADVKRPHNRDPRPRGLEADELRRLLAAVPESPSGLRDRAVIVTAVLTGLRRSEAMGLRAGDLTRNGTVYYSVRTKGGRERHRELPVPAFSAIVTALEAAGRPLESLSAEDRLFPVSSGAFYANLRRYAQRAGLEGVTPHVLRHSAAKLRRDAGASLEDVQRFLGHQNLATTARYLARLEGEHDDGWRAVADELGL